MIFMSVDAYTKDPHIASLHVFEGVVRQKILDVKYRNRRRYIREFAAELADFAQLHVDVSRYHMVTWPPTSDRRRRERGSDHAELLARHFGAYVRLPTRRLLRKTNRAPQTGAPRSVRLQQVQFVASVPATVRSVIVVDDVVTTGATMHAATDALSKQGVENVFCLAIAYTPQISRRRTPAVHAGDQRPNGFKR